MSDSALRNCLSKAALQPWKQWRCIIGFLSLFSNASAIVGKNPLAFAAHFRRLSEIDLEIVVNFLTLTGPCRRSQLNAWPQLWVRNFSRTSETSLLKPFPARSISKHSNLSLFQKRNPRLYMFPGTETADKLLVKQKNMNQQIWRDIGENV